MPEYVAETGHVARLEQSRQAAGGYPYSIAPEPLDLRQLELDRAAVRHLDRLTAVPGLTMAK